HFRFEGHDVPSMFGKFDPTLYKPGRPKSPGCGASQNGTLSSSQGHRGAYCCAATHFITFGFHGTGPLRSASQALSIFVSTGFQNPAGVLSGGFPRNAQQAWDERGLTQQRIVT